ncbi:hypothetical protein LAG90_16775 [Marinilongibacter aquaticus]|uniref:hypothetical protein n=1 Tax=Marinilongibacter aquaticus TaxID=2975157 RepID=UPI0021BDCF51|nr:hypothetical protein [Marinilongibacter aquaticus]UBM58459.1 hypothetical protein LAG90_16775 [Marinilongibacter aquaticus]
MSENSTQNNSIKQSIKLLVTCIFMLIMQQTAWAQLSTNKKVVFDLSQSENNEFNVIPYEKEGLLVLNSKAKSYGRENRLEFIMFNTNLDQKWSNFYEPGLLFVLLKYFETPRYFYCLFRELSSQKILVLRLDITTGDYVVNETSLLTNMEVDMFKVLKNKALIGGRYNDRPVVEMINLFANTGKVLPDVHSNNLELNNIEVNPDDGTIYLLLKNTRNCKMSLKTYDYDGKLVDKEVLGEKGKLPLNGKLIKIPDGNYVMAGNYADNCSDYSVGFYTHALSNSVPTRFYDFTQLKNFLSYMPEKRQSRVKNRILKKNQKGKDFKLRQRLLLHPPIESHDGLTVLAEVFYPEYKSYNSNFYPLGRNYRWGANNYYTFNNFRYTHALILHFNRKGELLWDNSLSLKNLESRTLDYKVQLYEIQHDKLVVAYPDEGVIKTNIVDGSDQTQEIIPLDLQSHDEKVVDTYQNELAAWYEQYFIAYGVQSVKQGNSSSPKEIFYLNKLTYKVDALN